MTDLDLWISTGEAMREALASSARIGGADEKEKRRSGAVWLDAPASDRRHEGEDLPADDGQPREVAG